ncbi:MAG: formylmethanofuran dehydrogenase subunit C [Nitrososphaerota archaeon]|jgi:formylmethanofuran dehydrogenase subunit C|uniref:formylmethanofuran dehydrogenase subunit C n=1 Tax=Candidatus Bathycorpusculum sp. TaxID=2994959 RepID=UPI00281C95E6|nr:formylmethanofuran dehydrogenase subunit C [Candidatus Termitimicrobium sp.]MCL2432009.1 formylmethanofuran dehydrogenase subunit C [Candidatus Termitimicrobium sp.]MDR0492908.1 formylmethanofuran dehydrogenase subunit C [Nitrososphaerota archaeon]
MVTLTAIRTFNIPIQAPCITPENFADKTIAELKKLPLTEGNRNVTLGDLFKIEQSPTETPNIILNGDLSKVKRVGQAMKSGEIVINGNIGMHTGEKMAGGKIVVNGNAGGWTGSEMKKGAIEIHGDGGDYIASPYRGNDLGMKGGLITIDGNVGTDVGCHLKGGIIKIKGSAGRFLGYHMTDGVIYVEKDCDVRAGACMTGGKIVIGGALEILPSFTIDSVKPKVKVDDSTNIVGPFYVFLGDRSERGVGKIFANKVANPALKFYEKYL